MTGLAVAGFIAFSGPAAGAPAVLGLHRGDDRSPSGADSTKAEPAIPRTKTGSGCLPRWLIWTLLLAIGGFGLISGACLDACTGSNRIRHVPAIHGRVVDMETGHPLAGVKITRWFERDMIVGPGGADSYRLAKSMRSATTDANGRFELPSWYGMARGINAIPWTEFKPGWVAGWGHLVTTSPPRLEIARGHPSDAFVEAETRREGSIDTIVLKLHRVDTPSAAEEHFWALRILLDDGVVKEESFVTEALSYSNTREVTLPLFRTFDSVLVDLGGQRHGSPCYKAELAWTLLGLEEQLCTQHSDWRPCITGGLERVRDFLQRKCPTFGR